MASRQSVSSILKPQKIRAPLKEIESVDQDVDEDTATMPKKKVSFSSMNNIKMFIAGASSLTVPTLFDDQVSMMSDSSNGEKTKLSGKLEKSDGQIIIESTNCINMEENGRVVIEYESPSDNMEMTEALSGKIFSDTMYTVDNNISKHTECSLDYSTNNMEFTQVVALGQILTADISNSSSVEMSETLINKDEQPTNQLDHNNSIPLHEMYVKNISCSSLHSSNMEITHANIKSHVINLSSLNESSNMELTNVSSVPLKSNCLNKDQTLCSMVEFTSNRQVYEDNCELINENCQKLISSELVTTSEINKNNNCEPEIVHDLYQKTTEINNDLNPENFICGFKNSNINEEIGQLSSSVVSMDIDSASKCIEDDNSSVNTDCLILGRVNHDQTNPIVPTILETDDKQIVVNDVQDDYSNVINIFKHVNCDVKTTMVPTSSSFVQETSPKNNLNKSVVVQEPQLTSTLLTHTSIFNESHSLEMDTSLEIEENHHRNYSRKTLIHSAPLIIQKRPFVNDDIVNTSAIVEENQQKISRKSVRLIATIIDQDSFKEDKDNSDLSDLIEENQNKYTSPSTKIKSTSPTSDFDQTQSLGKSGDSDSSVTIETDQPRYSRKSIACLPMLNQVQSPEDMSLSDTFMYDKTKISEKENTSIMVEKNQQQISRKSVQLIPTIIDQDSFKEDKDNSDLSDLIEENQNKCTSPSTKIKLASPTSDFGQTQSQKKSIDSDSSVTLETNQPRYSRKSIACIPMLNQVQSPEEMSLSNTFMYDKTQISEKENPSIIMVEKNVQKNYSRRTMGPTSILPSNNFSDDIDSSLSDYSFMSNFNNVDTSSIDDCNQSNDFSLVSNNSKIINHDVDLDLDPSNHDKSLVLKLKNQSVLLNVIDDDLNSPFRKKSKKNVCSSQLTNQSVYDFYEKNTDISNNKENKSDNTNDVYNSEDAEYSKMDISVEAEQEEYYCLEKISSQEKGPTLSTTFSLNNMSHIIKQPSNILSGNDANSSSLMNDLLEHNSKENSVSSTIENNNIVVDTLQENKELKQSVTDDVCEKVVLNEVEQIEIHLNELTEDNVNLIENNDKNINESYGQIMDTNDICIDDLANMSISVNADSKYKKSSLGNRKRSYSNIDSSPLPCPLFMYNPNDTTEKFIKEKFVEENRDIKVSEISINTDHLVDNSIEEDMTNEESVKEQLNCEVLEFLRKWNDVYFVENTLFLNTCNNNEWVFSMLNNNIKLTIKYSPILNDHLFLKVEDILLTTQITAEDEIIKFGTNWILSKYSPKVYKQICFTSRDVELLLKSLQEDIKFIGLVMKNMVFVRDVYCVTFKDNKAQFFVQSMHPLLMACVDVSLANIHKLSVKDITVDCLFGVFDLQIVNEIMEKLTKDFNVLQYLIENLKNSIRAK